MKICSKCKIETNDFAKGHSECKECNKKYRLARKEDIKKKNKEYYFKNKNTIDQKSKIYQSNNKEALVKYRAIYRVNNKNNLNSYGKKYRKDRYANDPEFRIKIIVSSLIYQSLRKRTSAKSGNSIVKYLPYSIKELTAHLERQFESWMNWNNHGKYNPKSWNENDEKTWTWQIDHIIPQSILSYTSMKDSNFKKCWSLDNLRPLSAKINILDGNRRDRI